MSEIRNTTYWEQLRIALQQARHENGKVVHPLCKVPPDMRHVNPREFEPIFFSFGLFNACWFCVLPAYLQPCDYYKIDIAGALTTQESFEQLVSCLVARMEDIRMLYRDQVYCDKAQPQDIAYCLGLDALTVVAAACYQECVNPRSMCTVIWHDALLLEQQLPMFVLQAAIDSITLSVPSSCSVSGCSRAQIQDVVNFYALQTSYPFLMNVKGGACKQHPPSPIGAPVLDMQQSSIGAPVLDMQQSLLRHIHSSFLNSAQATVVTTEFRTLPTASRLRGYGIKFAVGDGDFTGIRFHKKSRVLTVPQITVFSTTKSYLLNLAAQEVAVSFYNDDPCPVSSFILLMGFLIKAEEDVRVLVEAQVLYNHMGSHAQLVAMWNSLGVNLPISLTQEDSNVINTVVGACESQKRRRGLLHCLRPPLEKASKP